MSAFFLTDHANFILAIRKDPDRAQQLYEHAVEAKPTNIRSYVVERGFAPTRLERESWAVVLIDAKNVENPTA